MPDCIFCKIIQGKIPCNRIYEDDDAFIILDIQPVNKGHTLVLSKQHYETIIDIPPEKLKNIIIKVQQAAKILKKNENAEGITIAQNNGLASEQLVPHLHFHIIPRFIDDGHKYDWGHAEYRDEQEKQEYIEKIRKGF